MKHKILYSRSFLFIASVLLGGIIHSWASAQPWVHDPSRVWPRNNHYMFYVSARGPNAGIEERYFAPYSTEFYHNKYLFTGDDIPDWHLELLPGNHNALWAPDIMEVNGQLVMYYSISEIEAGPNTGVGRAVATGTAPDLEWTDAGQPVVYTVYGDALNVIDPSVFQDDDGSLWLITGGGKIWITQLNPDTGLLSTDPNEYFFDFGDPRFTRIAERWPYWIEASHLWKHNGYYYLFVNWGACCNGSASTYNIRVGRSMSITGPYLDKDGVDLADGGGSLLLEGEGNYRGPGHTGIYEKPNGPIIFTYHYYDSDDEGESKLGMCELNLDNGWPVVYHAMDYHLLYENYYSGGTGTLEDPFRIESAEDVNNLSRAATQWNKHYIMINDINLAGHDINTIGWYWESSDNQPFTGVFDGNNHTLSNLVMNDPYGNSTALFGYVEGSSARIKNLHLTDVNILGAHHVGSLIGKLTDGSVTNCSVEDALVSGTSNTGGLLGHLDNASLTNCFFRGTVLGQGTITYNIGGLVGGSDGGSMVNACADAAVTCAAEAHKIGGLVGYCSGTEIMTSSAYAEVNAGVDSDYVGGLIGTNFGSASNSYAAGSVSGNDSVGGLTGYNGVGRGGPSGGTLYNCYAAANVSGTTNLGGFTGQDTGTGDYTACFWDADLNPTLDGIGNTAEPNVMDKTTVHMQTETTFTDHSWDFTDVWAICEGTNYPQLLYQFLIAPDYLCPEGVDFFDYGFFADHWLMSDCHLTGDCNDTDLEASGTVDSNDLDIFTDNWLYEK